MNAEKLGTPAVSIDTPTGWALRKGDSRDAKR